MEDEAIETVYLAPHWGSAAIDLQSVLRGRMRTQVVNGALA
jgi:hypothetical protein